jgi:hypothetical protein
MKNFYLIIGFILLMNQSFSQVNDIQLLLSSTDTITNRNIEFKGLIINKSNKSKKILPLNVDCNNYMAPFKWTIQIKFKDLNYDYISPFVILAYGSVYHKIKKNQTYEVKFCIDFSKQAPKDNKYNLKDFVNTTNNDSIAYYFIHGLDSYVNDAYGSYKVKLLYDNYPSLEKNSIRQLESNMLNIKYIK